MISEAKLKRSYVGAIGVVETYVESLLDELGGRDRHYHRSRRNLGEIEFGLQ